MSKSLAILKLGICSICCVFLLGSCKSAPQKPVPVKHTVEIKGMKFLPGELVVNRGDTVVWINRDIVAHDVTEEPGKAWASPVIPSDASWSMVVNKSEHYYCSIHVVMKGKIQVQ